MIVITSCALPFFSYAHAAYFTLRSGGRVGITFLFDSVYMWTIVIPTVVLLANFTSIFEKGTYSEAIVFMVVNASDVYDMLNDFVEKL
jgi:Na+-driven multidrug efflux pump